MKTIARCAFALLMGIAAVPAAAQPGPGRPPADAPMDERMERRPFDLLLRHRQELELTDDQVRRLEAIGQRLEAANAPLRERLVREHRAWRDQRRGELERMTPEQRRAELRRMRTRGGPPEVPEPLRPVVHEMRVNINQAIYDAQGVLTADQRVRVQQMLRREVRGGRGGRGQAHPRHPGGRRPGGARPPRPGARP